jgi:hypothetical protein
MDESSNNLKKNLGENTEVEKNDVLDNVAPDRRSFVQRLIGMTGFATPAVRTFVMGSAAASVASDVYAASNTCPAGTDISLSLQNPSFVPSGPQFIPFGWLADGSPAPGFASYTPGTAQYPGGFPFPFAAYSPTVFGGSGVLRQLTGLLWAGGNTYNLKIVVGLPLKEPDGTTNVAGFPLPPNGAVRVYFTFGPGFGQVASFDIPSPPAGTTAENVLSITLPTNSPAIGQKVGVMIFVSAPSLTAANFVIVSCPS